MKIRNGFVSNSSSSSFVVAFPKKPETVEEVKDMLFGNGYDLDEGYDYPFDSGEPIKNICSYILNDVNNFTLNEEELFEQFFERINNILYCSLDIDYKRKKVTMKEDPRSNADSYLFVHYSKTTDALMACKEYLQAELDLDKIKDKFYSKNKKNYDDTKQGFDAYYSSLNSYIENHPKYFELKEKESIYDRCVRECALEDLKFFKKDTVGYFILIREYSDHEPIESVIEYGQVFRKLPSFKNCHH